MRLILAAALALAVASPVRGQEDLVVQAMDNMAVQQAVYSCEDGEQLAVNFGQGIAALTDMQGRSILLQQSVVASGFLYERDGQSLRGKGDEAVWTTPGMGPRLCLSGDAALSIDLPGYRDAANMLVHEASGMRFPLRAGSAVRLPSRSHDVQSDYAMVRYRVPIREGGVATVRLGLVQLDGMSAKQHYDVFRSRLLERLPELAAREEGPFDLPGARGGAWRGAFVGKDQAAGLVTADFGRWSVRVQSIYPLAQADEAQQAIAAFLRRLDWSPLSPPPPAPQLPGTRWQLAFFESSHTPAGKVVPRNPARYTLELRSDGRAMLRLDCNRGSAPWKAAEAAQEGSFAFGPVAATRAACPRGSLAPRLMRDLALVRSYALKDGILRLALEGDGGVYSWMKLP